MNEGSSVSVLEFPLKAHESEGGSSDLLVHHEHEGCRQHRLQQLRLQTFVQTQQPVSPGNRGRRTLEKLQTSTHQNKKYYTTNTTNYDDVIMAGDQ